MGAYEDDYAAPAEAVVQADGEELGDCDGRGEIIELLHIFQSIVSLRRALNWNRTLLS